MIDNKTRNCKVTIFGDCYSLVTNESEEHIAKASLLVDSVMQEIAKKATVADEKKIAVLTALRIASKVLQLEDEIDKRTGKEKQLIDTIDSQLRADSTTTL